MSDSQTDNTDNIDELDDINYLDYTFDEDCVTPFVVRPRVGRSPILTRSRSTFSSEYSHVVDTDIRMEENNEPSNGSQQGNSGPVGTNDVDNLSGITSRLERVLTLNHSLLMKELSLLKTQYLKPRTKIRVTLSTSL